MENFIYILILENFPIFVSLVYHISSPLPIPPSTHLQKNMHHQVLFTLWLFFLLPISYTQGDESLMQCFEPFECGYLKDLVFPFWNEDRPQLCRQQGFGLTGCGDDNQPPIINIGGTEFRLLYTDHTNHTMTIARDDLWETICPSNPITNVTLGGYPFLRFSPTNMNLTFFYDCQSSLRVQPSAEFQCPPRSFYADDSVDRDSLERFRGACGGGGIQVQVNRSAYERLQSEGRQTGFEPRRSWNLGFDVDYNFPGIFCDRCSRKNGLCDDLEAAPFPSRYPVCAKPAISSGLYLQLKLIIGSIAGASGLLVVACIFLCFRGKISCIRTTSFLPKLTNKDQDIEAFLRNNGSLAPKRYSYSHIKKMTNSFEEKLGKGGYGSVYKGKLPDNHLVAVKMLNTSKGNGQDFINEVASISRTSHVNIVTLLGFCLEGGKRALIYEFMPNGSLEKFIHEQKDPEDRPQLTVEDLYRIAIGIARGLEYLHLGCNTRILHFDIKPHNILLDDKFRPKISDFGLAKLCGGTDSIVSMLEARGTMGYVAPEVFCRNIGCVSHKSDVYSYGMMILEMAGGRKNLDVGVRRTSEIYFPHWIYRHLEQDDIEPELLGHTSKEETEIARKMIVVGLWCIQTNPKDRPSISEVKEMLQSKEALQIPPKP